MFTKNYSWTIENHNLYDSSAPFGTRTSRAQIALWIFDWTAKRQINKVSESLQRKSARVAMDNMALGHKICRANSRVPTTASSYCAIDSDKVDDWDNNSYYMPNEMLSQPSKWSDYTVFMITSAAQHVISPILVHALKRRELRGHHKRFYI